MAYPNMELEYVNNFNRKLVMQHDLNKNGDKFYDFIKLLKRIKLFS